MALGRDPKQRDLWAFVSLWSVDMFLTHTSCPLHVPPGHDNWSGVPSLFIWVLQSPFVTSHTHYTPLSVCCHRSPCPLLGKQSVPGQGWRPGDISPFPSTQSTTPSLHCSCSLSCLHWEYSSTLQLPYFFFTVLSSWISFAFKLALKCL